MDPSPCRLLRKSKLPDFAPPRPSILQNLARFPENLRMTISTHRPFEAKPVQPDNFVLTSYIEINIKPLGAGDREYTNKDYMYRFSCCAFDCPCVLIGLCLATSNQKARHWPRKCNEQSKTAIQDPCVIYELRWHSSEPGAVFDDGLQPQPVRNLRAPVALQWTRDGLPVDHGAVFDDELQPRLARNLRAPVAFQ